jgi:uncharacterized protein DUF4328
LTEVAASFAVVEAVGGAGTEVWNSHRVADPTKPPVGLQTSSWFAIGGLALVGLANLIAAAAAVSLHGAADAAGYAELARFDDHYQTFGRWNGLSWVAYFIAACMFMPWFALAYRNLRRLGIQQMRWGDGWAIGGWFVPFLSLARPKQIANDIWRGSESGADVSSERWHLGSVSAVIHWWWALFLIGGACGGVGTSIESGGHRRLLRGLESGTDWEAGLRAVRSGALVSGVGLALLVAAAVLGIVFVRRATERLDSIRQRLIVEPPPLPPAGPPAPVATPPVAYAQIVKCPQCAEFMLPGGPCPYCGYGLTGAADR